MTINSLTKSQHVTVSLIFSRSEHTLVTQNSEGEFHYKCLKLDRPSLLYQLFWPINGLFKKC